ncbi:uncharacterized protein LOC134578109 isoform X4 [Pelobates fuscus]|uniref:uncharacterized protein LOC134578109 isoform X4 n=1 Tax=Pelobates fuscus TaxID=191477 RepID=UPI002FE4399C
MGGVKKIQLVSLFLLFLNLGTCLSCKPKYWSLTSHYDNHINNLENNFALDYPTYTVSNLRKDSWCSEIWIFHLSDKELSRIKEVSGENLKKSISPVLKEFEFLNDCSFTISEDCRVHRNTNMSEFIDTLRSINRTAFMNKRDYSNCTEILCEKGGGSEGTTRRGEPADSHQPQPPSSTKKFKMNLMVFLTQASKRDSRQMYVGAGLPSV